MERRRIDSRSNRLLLNTNTFPSQSNKMPSKSNFHPPPKSNLPFDANPKSKRLSRSQFKNASPRLQKTKKEFPRKLPISNSAGKPLQELNLVPPNANSSFISPLGKLDLLATVVVVDDDIGDFAVDKVHTPPVEASVSPDIQCVSHAKILASESGATPVCYGAGHLLSGVTDRRKCRRRGSLKGGCSMPDMSLDYTKIDDDPSVPLLATASVRWHLSPQGQRNEDDQASSRHLGNELLLSDLGGIDNVASKVEDRRSNESLKIKVMEGEFSATSHNSFRLSTGSLSSGNMIQTPNSDLRSDWFLGRVEMDKTDFVESEINLLTSTWSAPGFGDMDLSLDSGDLIKVQKNEDCVSWVSDGTLGNLGLSQMRISWRDGLESTAFEMEKLDRCWSLSDEEEINLKCDAIVENQLETEDDDLLPEILDYEPIVSDKQKGKASPHLTNTCAESIFTNGSSLFASQDSDWTGCLSNNSLKFSTHN